MQKKIISIILSLILLFILTACGNDEEKSIVLITDANGITDMHYNSPTYEALKQSSQDFNFKSYVYEPNNANDFVELIDDSVLLEPKLIIFSSPVFEFESVIAAEDYPEQNFIFVESNADLNLDGKQDSENIYSIDFDRSQAGFLSGIVAGNIATNKVSFVGNDEFLSYIEYESGFRAGIRTVNPDVDVQVKYYPEDISEDQMYTYILALINDGTEVIYTLNKNNGLYQAAEEYGIPVIGFDYDYRKEIDNPASIIMYIEKDINRAVYLSIQDYFNGLYKGQVKKYSLTDDCLHLVVLDNELITPTLEALVQSWIEEITYADIVIPSTREDLKNYSPPILTIEEPEEEPTE